MQIDDAYRQHAHTLRIFGTRRLHLNHLTGVKLQHDIVRCLDEGWASLSNLAIRVRSRLDIWWLMEKIQHRFPKLCSLTILINHDQLAETLFTAAKYCIPVKEFVIQVRPAFRHQHLTLPLVENLLKSIRACSLLRLSHFGISGYIVGPAILAEIQRSMTSLNSLALEYDVSRAAFPYANAAKDHHYPAVAPHPFHPTFSLSELRLTRILAPQDSAALDLDSTLMPQLTSLDLTYYFYELGRNTLPVHLFEKVFSKPWPSLASLKISFIHDRMARQIATACPNLTHLCIHSITAIDQVAFHDDRVNFNSNGEVMVPPASPNIIDSQQYQFTNLGVLALLCSLRHLVSMSIEFLSTPEGSPIDSRIVVPGPNSPPIMWVAKDIALLYIEGWSIELRYAPYLLRQLPYLKKLHILLDSLTQSGELGHLWASINHQHLYELSFNFGRNLSDDEKRAIITFDFIKDLLAHLPAVKVLNI
ncbi:hypothetical protein EV182_002279, partial [Spiromyces aspiralis]